jgi:hypothetical protein
LISSWSFAKAISEPENEIDPIRAESMIAIDTSPWMRPDGGASSWNSASATSAAAPPPTPLKSATICGIAVICTRRAPTAPKAPPTSAATTISQFRCTPAFRSVATIAITIPTAPIWLPRRAVAGDERKRSARMKQMIVTR